MLPFMKKTLAYGVVFALFLALSAPAFRCRVSAESGGGITLLRSEKGELLKEGESRKFTFDVPAAGKYELRAGYLAAGGKAVTPQVELSFDSPDTESSGTVLDMPRLWKNDLNGGRFLQDDLGNERLPAQSEVEEWQTMTLSVSNSENGLVLNQGGHTLSLHMARQSVYIKELLLVSQAVQPSCREYIARQDALGAKDTQGIEKFCEAELTWRKSHPEIVVSYDRTTPAVTPNHPSRIRYNILGGTGYSTEGQWVSWQVDAPQSGYYTLDFRYRQNINHGLDSRRRLYIDDTVLFKECNELVFPYSESFSTLTVSDAKGKPCRIYLKEGRHTVKLEVTLGSAASILRELEQVVQNLNRLYNKIIIIVGETPDAYRDYDLDKHIKGLLDTFRASADKLDSVLSKLGGGRQDNGDTEARISEVARNLRRLAGNPRKIPSNQDILRSNINTLADLTANMRNQPLELDSFTLRSPDRPAASGRTGFWELLAFRIKSLINSFTSDYTTLHRGGRSGSQINVWVSTNSAATIGYATGRDQAQIITQLIQDSFYTETGISVGLSLMDSSSLIQAMVSGKGPDAAMLLEEQALANLYFRNALADLREMPGYDQIEKRFYPSAMIALKNGDKTFAFPEVQSFNMLFYRTDILGEYGLEPPETWDAFYKLLTGLQKNGMQIGVAESPQIYEMLLLQNGGQAYTGDMTRTLMTSEASVNAFTAWTELYVRHSIPVAFDALNRFRTGQLPVVISPVSFYSTLQISAPEIHNLWRMAMVPGVRGKDGSIDRSQSCTVSGVAVMNGSKEKEEAFRFVEWWTRTDTQNRFGFECDTRLGVSARYFPANIESLSSLPWSADEYGVLYRQRESLSDIPLSPASYYLSRNLSNAFRRVVYSYENPRDVIYRYGREVDSELARKRRELGMEEGKR